ncbi:acyl-CoA dehydrogenase [Nitrincola sp. MINF-07-Sa-05]|uniref:acyl-CoA dehydrogenase n=1 Tax=Nitrincola salilacus TaxID=3400273 RepID=UPI0039184700
MLDYHAPRADIAFILQHHIGADALAQVDSCAALDSSLMQAIVDEAGRFAEQVLAPLNAAGDIQGCQWQDGQVITPEGWADAYAHFRAAGWTGLCLPEALGGQALPKVLAMPVAECWQSANLAFSMIQPLTEGAVEALLASGDDNLISRYGPLLVSGDWTASMALTEPGAGSDLGLLSTRAKPDAAVDTTDRGGYRLTGNKLFITFGQHDMAERIVHFVLARLPGAPAGSQGISLFAVPSIRMGHRDGAPNGVYCTGIEHKMGLHGSPTCSLTFDNAWGELVGPAHQGLRIMFVMMNEARLSVGLQGTAVAERAYQAALGWAQERRQGKHPLTGESPTALIHHPDIRRLLLRMRSQIMASRLLGYYLGFRVDQARQTQHPDQVIAHDELELLTPVYKAWSTEYANRLAGDAIQVFGGMGYIEETGVAQFYRDLKVSTIYEGTTGVQAQDFLWRKISKDQGAVWYRWLDQVIQDGSAPVVAAAQALRDSTERLLSTLTDLQLWHAASVALLEATGVLAGAWQLNRAVVAADAPEVDPAYRSNLIALNAFYQAHWLPELHLNLARVQHANVGLMDYDFQQ